ncbi:hypothetical protein [Spirosoma pulveris]
MEAQREIEWLEPDIPSLSACAFCKFRLENSSCDAYPGGIPERWLFTNDVHDQVEPDQQGTAVFMSTL